MGIPPHRQFAALILSLAVGLLASEALVRAYAELGGEPGERLRRFDPMAAIFVPHGEFGYRQRPLGEQRYESGAVAHSNGLAFRGPEVEIPKPAGVFRIVLLGGSTTHGFGVDDDETIDAHMRRLLAERHPELRAEVVNLALGAYDSYQVFERMRSDGMRLEPDLVIVNTGINDVRNAQYEDLRIPGPDPRTLIWEDHLRRLREEARRGGPSLWTRLKHWSYLARIPAFGRELLNESRVVERHAKLEPRDAAVAYFASNVRRTADLAHSAGAALILSTPPSALPFYEPTRTSTRSYWIVDAATTETYRRRLARRLESLAEELRAEGRPAVYLDPGLPEAMFLDDCHLTSEGNRAVALRFVEASEPFLPTTRRADPTS